MTTVEPLEWAEQQPLALGLLNGRLVQLSAEQQGPDRLLVMRRIAESIFGCADRAVAWMAAPSSALGGLSPEDLAGKSEEASQLALKSLIRWHRSTLRPTDV